MERAGSLVRILLLPLTCSVGVPAASESAFAPAATPPDSARAAPSDRTESAPPPSDSVVLRANPSPGRPTLPSVTWSVGVGAPVFPQRDRFQLELSRRVAPDSLVVDQPWDGSQLGFSTGLEVAYQHGWLRPAAGLEWSFWDSRSVHHPRSGNTSVERTWRVDQLVGLVGLDALIAPALLKINGAQAPFVGIRYARGAGRLEGWGRAWATGTGVQMHLGADVTTIGPLVVAGRLGWNSLSFTSSSDWNRVLYGNDTPGEVSWNGSGIWMRMDLRLGGPVSAARADSVPTRKRAHSAPSSPSDAVAP